MPGEPSPGAAESPPLAKFLPTPLVVGANLCETAVFSVVGANLCETAVFSVVGANLCDTAVFAHNDLRARYRGLQKVRWSRSIAARAEASAMKESKQPLPCSFAFLHTCTIHTYLVLLR